MLNSMRCCPVIGLVLFFGLIAGCATKPTRTDLVASGAVKVITESSPRLEVSQPLVLMDNDVFEISGTVQRKPGDDGYISGHLDLTITAADGKEVNRLLLDWLPREIPITGKRSAQYILRYPWQPPQGATIKIEFDDGSRCASARRSNNVYSNSYRMAPGVGLVPYDSPGGAVYTRPNPTNYSAIDAARPAYQQGYFNPGFRGSQR